MPSASSGFPVKKNLVRQSSTIRQQSVNRYHNHQRQSRDNSNSATERLTGSRQYPQQRSGKIRQSMTSTTLVAVLVLKLSTDASQGPPHVQPGVPRTWRHSVEVLQGSPAAPGPRVLQDLVHLEELLPSTGKQLLICSGPVQGLSRSSRSARERPRAGGRELVLVTGP